MSDQPAKPRTLADYDIWYKPCEHCGFDTAKSSAEQKRCWKCGRNIHRDFSDRALKKPTGQPLPESSAEALMVKAIKDATFTRHEACKDHCAYARAIDAPPGHECSGYCRFDELVAEPDEVEPAPVRGDEYTIVTRSPKRSDVLPGMWVTLLNGWFVGPVLSTPFDGTGLYVQAGPSKEHTWQVFASDIREDKPEGFDPGIREIATCGWLGKPPAPAPDAGSSEIPDLFSGDNRQLRESIAALLKMDRDGVLVPHGISGHAKTLLSAAYNRI